MPILKRRAAKSVREQFDTFVVLGIGGSALGPIAVQQALNHLHYNELPAEKRGGPRFYVEDNIDPERMAALSGRDRRKEDLLQRHHQVRRHRRNHEPVPDRFRRCSRRQVGERLGQAHHRHHRPRKGQPDQAGQGKRL